MKNREDIFICLAIACIAGLLIGGLFLYAKNAEYDRTHPLTLDSLRSAESSTARADVTHATQTVATKPAKKKSQGLFVFPAQQTYSEIDPSLPDAMKSIIATARKQHKEQDILRMIPGKATQSAAVSRVRSVALRNQAHLASAFSVTGNDAAEIDAEAVLQDVGSNTTARSKDYLLYAAFDAVTAGDDAASVSLLSEYRKRFSNDTDLPIVSLELALAYARSGERVKAEALLSETKNTPSPSAETVQLIANAESAMRSIYAR